MLKLNINDETSKLKAVVLGLALSNGPTPKPEEAYDPKSLEHILAGTYPTELDMVYEMDAFCRVLEKYGIVVFRPELIQNYNQIFVRDIIDKNNLLPQTDASKVLQTQEAQQLIDTIPAPLREIPLLITNIASGADKVLYGNGVSNDITARLKIDGII